jgi:methylamine---glutamate N-methyltransferase subunit C
VGTCAARPASRIKIPERWHHPRHKSAIQAGGCIAARICHTNNCQSGVATQKPELRKRLDVDAGAQRLARFLTSATALMQVLSRACGHDHLCGFNRNDLSAWQSEMRELTGLR